MTAGQKGSQETSSGPQGRRLRIDLVSKVTSFDKATGICKFELAPDPRRYEWRTVEGKSRLFDRLDRLLFPEDVLSQLAEHLKDQPIYYEPARIDDASTYASERKPIIRAALQSQAPMPLADPSASFLESLDHDRLTLEFAILSVDLVGSTQLATQLRPTDYARLVQVVSFELSEVVPLFRGHVLKYTGDGLIAYFPAPSFIIKNDLALDCALTIQRLVSRAINPAITESGYAPVQVRIGIDSGQAAIVVLGSPATKRAPDLIGAVISLACKIQSKAPIGGIAIGDMTLRNLHTRWRAICKEQPTPADWTYADSETGEPYKMHAVDPAAFK